RCALCQAITMVSSCGRAWIAFAPTGLPSAGRRCSPARSRSRLPFRSQPRRGRVDRRVRTPGPPRPGLGGRGDASRGARSGRPVGDARSPDRRCAREIRCVAATRPKSLEARSLDSFSAILRHRKREAAMGQMKIRIAPIAAGLLAALAAAPAPAQAQSWPQRPVRFIVPFGPGAGADIGARLIQERLQKKWGQPVVIDNRPGGDSMIAIQAVLAASDDHTFLWGPSGNFIVHPYLYKKLPYNPDDLLPIASFSATVLSVGVPASLGVGNLADFVKRARAEAGKLNSAAVAGITELAFDYFAVEAGVTFPKVPHPRIGPAGDNPPPRPAPRPTPLP